MFIGLISNHIVLYWKYFKDYQTQTRGKETKYTNCSNCGHRFSYIISEKGKYGATVAGAKVGAGVGISGGMSGLAAGKKLKTKCVALIS